MLQTERLYGRRFARPLRQGKQAQYEEGLSHFLFSKERLHVFQKKYPMGLYLEIGFGSGEHLLAHAKNKSDALFIGCEPFVNGVAQALSHRHEQKIENVLIWNDDVRQIVHEVLGQLDGIYLLFNDPWPKKRHHKRRFIQPQTIRLLYDLLKEGGFIKIATDHTDLRMWMINHFEVHQHLFKLVDTDIFKRPSEQDWPYTRYEQKAHQKGHVCAYMHYQKCS